MGPVVQMIINPTQHGFTIHSEKTIKSQGKAKDSQPISMVLRKYSATTVRGALDKGLCQASQGEVLGQAEGYRGNQVVQKPTKRCGVKRGHQSQ